MRASTQSPAKRNAGGTPPGPNKTKAQKLANKLASEAEGRDGQTRSLTFGAYLTNQWLPGKANTLAESTWHGYRRKIERHILPTLGKVPLRRLKVDQLDKLYDAKLRPIDTGVKALAPRLRSIPKHETQAWTADQVSVFLQAAVGHRLFPVFWLAANTGMRRSELLGLRWTDIDFDKATVSVNRGLVAVGYEPMSSIVRRTSALTAAILMLSTSSVTMLKKPIVDGSPGQGRPGHSLQNEGTGQRLVIKLPAQDLTLIRPSGTSLIE